MFSTFASPVGGGGAAAPEGGPSSFVPRAAFVSGPYAAAIYLPLRSSP